MDLSFLNNMRTFYVDQFVEVLKRSGCIAMSWGISNFQHLCVGKDVRGISFEVNGFKFQGTVVVSVNGLDWYEVRFVKEGEIVHELDDVYVGDLVSLIDEYVEKQEEYVR